MAVVTSKYPMEIHGRRERTLLLLVAVGLESLFVLVLADLLFSLLYDTAHGKFLSYSFYLIVFSLVKDSPSIKLIPILPFLFLPYHGGWKRHPMMSG